MAALVRLVNGDVSGDAQRFATLLPGPAAIRVCKLLVQVGVRALVLVLVPQEDGGYSCPAQCQSHAALPVLARQSPHDSAACHLALPCLTAWHGNTRPSQPSPPSLRCWWRRLTLTATWLTWSHLT